MEDWESDVSDPTMPPLHYSTPAPPLSHSGNQICSGRGGGAGCQSNARSTAWRIRWNHHWARVNRRSRRRIDGQRRAALKPNSIC
jgi:hypothetical protein